MPNTIPLFRQKAILQIIKRKPYANFKEIEAFVNRKLEEQYYVDDKTKVGFTIRTFQRDLKDVYQIFGTEVKYSKALKGYYIESDIGDHALEQLISAFDVLNALKLSTEVAPFVFSENLTPGGTEHLFGILHAIQGKFFLEFEHQKFWEEYKTNRKVKPYAVKEFRNRWYLVAEDEKDGRVKTFGLDRISNLKITTNKFKTSAEVNLVEKFQHYYGVIGSEDEQPTEITLAFTALQGKYIKSLPIHASQKTIHDTEEETVVTLQIFPTLDFIMELLSYGAEVKVIAPQWLAADVKERHERASGRYKED